jgi:hypothetical protein
VKYTSALKASLCAVAFTLIANQLSATAAPIPEPTSPEKQTVDRISVNVSAPAEAFGVSLGIYQTPTLKDYGNELNAVNNLIGKHHGLIEIFIDFSAADPFDVPYLGYLLHFMDRQVAEADKPVIMLSWLPMSGKKKFGCNKDYADKEGISPRTIATGGCDVYIRNWAKFIKRLPYRFILKPAQEMSVEQIPWWPFRFGETPQDFINMWRHMVTIFKEEGVTNVEWFWGISAGSYPPTPENSHHNYYPGDEWVDWVGIIADNYYKYMWSPQPWRDFTWFTDKFLNEFTCKYPKPQMIHEMGSVEALDGAGSKSKWIRDAYANIPKYPFLRGIVYFNSRDISVHNSFADFRVTTGSEDSTNGKVVPHIGFDAYKEMVSHPVYRSDVPYAKDVTPPYTWCSSDTSPQLVLSTTSLAIQPGAGDTISVTSKMHGSAWQIEFTAVPQLSVQSDLSALPAPWGGTAKIAVSAFEDTPAGIYTFNLKIGDQTQAISVLVGDIRQALSNQVFVPMAYR